MQLNLKKQLQNIVKIFLLVLVGILIAIALRVFLFASFKIPSPSMEPAIMAGDYIIVNKLIPGPRIMKNFFSLKTDDKPVFERLNGYREIKRNDVLVFNYPYSDWNKLDLDLNVYYAKRCVAIPGDTFYIDNGIYKVKGVTDTLGYYPTQLALSQKKDKDFDDIIYTCFPFDSIHNWNIKNFGPLYVPKKGDTLSLDSISISLYKNLITYETGKPLNVVNDTIFLDNQLINKYIFRKNYYFMAGDYAFDSKDSRYWGLLPEDHIIGKASFVWKSENIYTGKIRWDRFFKIIN